jgi:hypothetical protein
MRYTVYLKNGLVDKLESDVMSPIVAFEQMEIWAKLGYVVEW